MKVILHLEPRAVNTELPERLSIKTVLNQWKNQVRNHLKVLGQESQSGFKIRSQESPNSFKSGLNESSQKSYQD